jgi:hypothetical protein
LQSGLRTVSGNLDDCHRTERLDLPALMRLGSTATIA